LTIVGNNFGYDSSVINVTFEDNTPCTVTTVEMTSITCMVTRLSDGAVSPITVTVSINGVEDNSLTISLID